MTAAENLLCGAILLVNFAYLAWSMWCSMSGRYDEDGKDESKSHWENIG